jgi:hypothetical protein
MIFLLPIHNLPVMIKANMPIPGLGETISLNGRKNDATLRRGGRSYHRDIVDIPRRSRREWNYRGKVEKPLPKKALLHWRLYLLLRRRHITRNLIENKTRRLLWSLQRVW